MLHSLQSLQRSGNDQTLEKVMSEMFQVISPPTVDFMSLPSRCRSCAVVGNSGNLQKSGNGELIDSHNSVIRYVCTHAKTYTPIHKDTFDPPPHLPHPPQDEQGSDSRIWERRRESDDTSFHIPWERSGRWPWCQPRPAAVQTERHGVADQRLVHRPGQNVWHNNTNTLKI